MMKENLRYFKSICGLVMLMLLASPLELSARRKKRSKKVPAPATEVKSDKPTPELPTELPQIIFRRPEDPLPAENITPDNGPDYNFGKIESELADITEEKSLADEAFDTQLQVIEDNFEENFEEMPDLFAQNILEEKTLQDTFEPSAGKEPVRVMPNQEYLADLYPETHRTDSSEPEKEDIYFNFEGAELKSFIEYIAEMRGMNIIPDKGVSGNKISLNIRTPISKSGAWNVFLTILDMAGFSLIKVGPVYKVVPKDKKLNQPLPAFINIPSEELPDNDATIRYVLFLNNISIKDVKPLLTSMLGQPHSIIEQPNVNGMIITDKSYNIKSAMKVIQELDQTGLQESVFILRLKRANAREVKELFDSLIKKPQGNPLARLLGKQAESSTDYFSPTTKIIAEERTNSLILLGNNKSLEKVKDFIVNNIDIELKDTVSPLRIYELQHTNAQDVVEILREVTASSNFDSPAGKQAAQHGAIRGGVKYFKNMTFQADKEGNRLIVSCTDEQDWKLLKQTIKDIDKAQPQIAIQMMVVTVAIDKNKELGGQLRSKTGGELGKGVEFQTTPMGGDNTFVKTDGKATSMLGNLLNSITAGQGAAILGLGQKSGDEKSMWGIFKALQTEENASVLSQPFLVTTNRNKGELRFGEKRFVTTEEAVSSSGEIGKASGKKPLNADTVISVTPQINMDGVIRLNVDIDINEFVDDAGSTQRKKLVTDVTVANGQVLVLGGFVKTKVSEGGGKTPILGDIPLLGWLFKNKNRSVSRNYVFIFMSPTIIKPRKTPGVNLYTKMKLHKATSDVKRAVETDKTNDPIHDWFFNADGEEYSHKVVDFANARYQPTTVDIAHDAYYRSETKEAISEIDRTISIAKSASPQEYLKAHKKKLKAEQLKKELEKERDNLKKIITTPVTQPRPANPPAPQVNTPEFKPTINSPAREPDKSMAPETKAEIPELESYSEPSPELSRLEDEIAQKRSRLKDLFGSGSMGDFLSFGAPTDQNESKPESSHKLDFVTKAGEETHNTEPEAEKDYADEKQALTDFFAPPSPTRNTEGP